MRARRAISTALVGLVLATTAAIATATAPVPVAAADPALSMVSIDAGYQSTCGVASDGKVECWGDGRASLGLGPSAADGAHPRSQEILSSSTVLAGKTIAQVSVGGLATPRGGCALTTDNVLACWGGHPANTSGGPAAPTAEPVAVATAGTPLAGETIAEISVGGAHACALTAEGAVACWGNNGFGALGTADGLHHPTPTAVATSGTALAGKTVAHISAGSDHTCAVTTGGQVVCWGLRRLLGNGNSGGWTGTPTALTTTGTALAGKTVSSLSAGVGHTCAVASDGSAACWGDSRLGLGNAIAVNPYTPVAVTTAGTPLQGKQIREVSAGGYFTCAVTTDNVLACWGKGAEGQLGDGHVPGGANHDVTLPTAVLRTGTPLAGATVAHVTTGEHHACAVATNGVAACWGRNGLGQLGDGTTTTSGVPRGVLPRALVPSAPTGVTVAAGNGRATLRWTPPSSPGGSAITRYQVALYRSDLGPATGAFRYPEPSGTATSGVVSATNGVTYRARVRAVNSTGTKYGTWSALSSPFMPRATHTPFASTTALVDRLFADIVGRPPTAAERTQWVKDLDDGVKTKAQLADVLRRGSENTTNVDPTARLYRAVLGRAPDAGGLDYWIGRRRSGTWSLLRMADFFAGSAEFSAKYGSLTDRAFVTRIYTDVLGRTAEPAGVDYWTAEITSGRRSRGNVILGFSESAEYRTKQREATDVSVAHILLMDRAPTTGETSAWVNAQRGGTTHTALLLGLLDSPAYLEHIT